MGVFIGEFFIKGSCTTICSRLSQKIHKIQGESVDEFVMMLPTNGNTADRFRHSELLQKDHL